MLKRILAALMLLPLLGGVLAQPAAAQYYRQDRYDDDYDRPPPRRDYRYDDRRDDYRRDDYRRDDYRRPPAPPPGYRPPPPPPPPGAPPRGMRGSVCVTSRGSCPSPFVAPPNSPCACDIPGFGKKRGAIGY